MISPKSAQAIALQSIAGASSSPAAESESSAEASRSETRLWLAPDIHCVALQDHVLIAGERQVLDISGAVAQLADGIALLRRGATPTELCDLCGHVIAHKLISNIAACGWLVTEHDQALRSGQFGQVAGWLAGRTSQPVTAMARLASARIAVLGVGGLGTQVIEHLAGAGVGHFVAIDGDVVASSNLNRQYMFDHGCIGRRKVDVAAERIVARNPDARVKTYPAFFATASELSCLDDDPIDVFVNCADRPLDIDRTVASYCAMRGVPFITAGVGLSRGYWGPFLVPDLTCGWQEFMSSLRGVLPDVASTVYGAAGCTSSFGPFNSVIASLLAADVVSWCCRTSQPSSLGRRMFFDFDTLRMNSFPDASPSMVAQRSAGNATMEAPT